MHTTYRFSTNYTTANYRAVKLGAIFILRKGKGVGRWYSKILTIPYRGWWVGLDPPYVRKKVHLKVELTGNHSLSQLPLNEWYF